MGCLHVSKARRLAALGPEHAARLVAFSCPSLPSIPRPVGVLDHPDSPSVRRARGFTR